MSWNAVLIGASDRSVLWRHGQLNSNQYDQFVEEYAAFLARYFDNVIVTPDDGVYTDIAQKFAQMKGVKPIAYYPDQDTYYGFEHLKPNFEKYELRPIQGDWYKLDAELTKQSLTVIMIGLSPGALIEGSFIKYHQKYGKYHDPKLAHIHWYIDERTIEQRLPKCLEEQIQHLHYYHSLPELEQQLEQQKVTLRNGSP